MKKLFLSAILLAGLAACQNKPASQSKAEGALAQTAVQSEVDSLKKAVLATHDRVMPEMNPMGHLRNRLKELAPLNPSDSGLYREARQELARAQDQMMGWMRQFKLPKDSSAAFQKDYLKDQYRMIREIEALTKRAMRRARQLINQADTAKAGA